MVILPRVYELDCTIPLESELKVQIFDYDYLSGDDLIGETKIDLENRYLSTHRGVCGLPKRYYTLVFVFSCDDLCSECSTSTSKVI